MRAYLIITQIVYVLCLIPWFPIWGLSFMSFDGGFSFYNILFVLIISLYPVAVIACTIFSWIFRKKRKTAAIIINLIPMLWVVGLTLVLFTFRFS
ncbi:hypothetical protein [Niallia taxi]|uniref:hypothetical protein n=1 Tax=Niallia taxi TaxID=2499688 RepID=UPI003D26A027